MESGAKGCEVVVSGKLRAARAKSMKFTDGFMIHSGQPAVDFVDYAVRHVMLRQGVLGIKVKMYVLLVAYPPDLAHSHSWPQYERLGSRRPDRPTKASPRLRPNCRPTSGQARVRAILRTKGARQHSPAAPAEDPYPQQQQEGGYQEETFGESAAPF
jgi:small subunit ribosomal protein S3e